MLCKHIIAYIFNNQQSYRWEKKVIVWAKKVTVCEILGFLTNLIFQGSPFWFLLLPKSIGIKNNFQRNDILPVSVLLGILENRDIRDHNIIDQVCRQMLPCTCSIELRKVHKLPLDGIEYSYCISQSHHKCNNR